MSANDNPEIEFSTEPNADPSEAPPGREKWYWLRQLLAGNPFYLVSAALLLFGINRLSVDPDFLEAETAKLIFNFSALQLYEVLLVLVGIVLAKRRIWYDSTLLVGLENLLVLVPFILVTQALLIGNGVTLALCLSGTLMAVLRFASLRKFIPELNLPPRLLGCGLIVLLVNLAIPIYYRWRLVDGVADFWAQPNQWFWLAGLPVLQLLANGLPQPRNRGGIAPQRSWLPMGMFELWMAATAVHLYCIAYVDKLPCGFYLLAPLLWAVAWTLYRRIEDFLPKPAPALRSALLIAPALATILGAAHENSYIFLGLTLLNILVYGWLCLSNRKNYLAFQLLLVSLVALLAGLPLDPGKNLMPEFSRGRCVAMAFGALVVLQSLLSRRLYIGACGAIIAAMVPVFLGWEPQFHLAMQTGLAFLLAHSVRWAEREQTGASALRIVTATAWMLHSILFTHVDPSQGWKLVSAAAALVLLCYFGAWLITGSWAGLIIPAGAIVSLLAAPANYLLREVMASPAGLLAIAASFLLFGLGTLLALTKPRWHRPPPDARGVTGVVRNSQAP